MIRKALFLLPICLFLIFGINGVSDAKESELTLATYNVRNLFDGVQNPGKPPEKAKPEKEMQALAAAIRQLNADVIAFQEVETKEVLEKFRNRYLKDMGYTHVILLEGNDERGIDVGLMSRLPILDIHSHKDIHFPIAGQKAKGAFSRDLLQVKLKANEHYEFTVFIAHLKSKHGGEAASLKRQAEAQTIRDILMQYEKQHPRANFVLMGDFNDTPDAKALRPLLKDGAGLYDAIGELGANVYTYHPKKYRSRIDYILISPSMKPEYIEKSVQIHQGAVFYQASDHLPATVRFDVRQDR